MNEQGAEALAKALQPLIEERDRLRLQLEELRKEAKFRIEAADLWVSQLRVALSEAMDALASDPEHDVSLQARLEIARRGIVIEQREGVQQHDEKDNGLVEEFLDAASECFHFMRSKAPKNCYQMVPWIKLRAAVVKAQKALGIPVRE